MPGKGEYVLVQAALPNTNIENIGIILLDADSDRLYCRFRRDFEVFVGNEAEWFEQLPNDISEKANELGAQKCLKWMEATFSNALRLSSRKTVLSKDFAATVDRLYEKHIRSNGLLFVQPEGWFEVRSDIPLTDDMFITHVKEPAFVPSESR